MPTQGSRGHIGIGPETEWGTPVEATKYLPFVSETLVKDIEQVISGAQKSVIDEPASYSGLENIGGDIVIEVYPEDFGDVLRSALGEPTSSQVETTTAYEHEFEPTQDDFLDDCPLCPYTFEVYRAKGDSFQYAGGVVNTLGLSFGVDEKILRATLGLLGKDKDSITKTTPSYEDTDPFLWKQATIKIATVENTDLQSISVNIDNHLSGKQNLNNTALFNKIFRSAPRTVEVSLDIDFENQDQYDIFEAQTEQAFEITLVGKEIETGHNYTLTIEIPKLRYTSFPINVGGEGLISSSVSGKAKYSATDGYAIKITLKNTTESY